MISYENFINICIVLLFVFGILKMFICATNFKLSNAERFGIGLNAIICLCLSFVFLWW